LRYYLFKPLLAKYLIYNSIMIDRKIYQHQIEVYGYSILHWILYGGVSLVSVDEFIIVSSNYVPGYEILETKGFVYGLTVRSRGVGGQIGAGLRSVFGGEIKEYVQMMQESRNEALERCIEHARELGANAIISARFDSDAISDIMQEILAYGTAVVAQPVE
jgi:uncharacterized protein YbjQ (UPF0145 family)